MVIDVSYIDVQFMKNDGTWRSTTYHQNNLKKQYKLFKTTKYYDYYRSDTTDMIYRIKKSYMKKIHILLSEESWNELEDIKRAVNLPGYCPKSYQQYLEEEKKKPTCVYLF